MNTFLGDITAEITCMNIELTHESTLEDFKAWLKNMSTNGYDKQEYPNFKEYNSNPEKYWPFVQQSLSFA